MITELTLPPKAGYVEVIIDGEHVYKNAKTGVLLRDEVAEQPTETPEEYVTYDELASAYQEGVNSIG